MYEKPQIADAHESIRVIEGSTSTVKNVNMYMDGLPPNMFNATSPAYEADE